MPSKLVVIDGNSILHQAYHAMPPLNDRQGRPTGAVTGFLNIALSLLKTANPTHIGVVFDSSGSHRHHFFDDYKGDREGMVDDLSRQYFLVRKIVKKLGWKIVKQKGFEADDIVASLSLRGVRANYETIIYSSDKDFIQLMPEGVKVYLPINKRFRDEKYIIDKYGVNSNYFLTYQMFVGDSIDGIKGVKGIGNKTACELIERHDDFHSAVWNAHKETKPSVRKALIESLVRINMIEAGVTLVTDLPLNEPGLDWLQIKSYDQESLSKFLLKYDLKQLNNRLSKREPQQIEDTQKGLFD